MSDKCPFCGSDKHPRLRRPWLKWEYYWECGTNHGAGTIEETGDECKVRQIAQQAERIADLERRLENAEKRLDFDRRVEIHFQSHISNSSGDQIKLSADSKRWTATIYDQWSILPEQVVGARTLEELLTLPALEAVNK